MVVKVKGRTQSGIKGEANAEILREIAQLETGPEKVEVQRLWESLSEVVDPAELGTWFRTACQAFGGSTPIDVIGRGEIDRLWEMSHRLHSGLPG